MPSRENYFTNCMSNTTLRSITTSVMFDGYASQDLEGQRRLERQSRDLELCRSQELERASAKILGLIVDSTFKRKYGLDFSEPSSIHCYLFTQQPRESTYVFEAFASVACVPPDSLKRKKECLVFHSLFEDVIERYTKSRAKPNPVLMETRNSEFGYRTTIYVEAVPIEVQAGMGFGMSSLRLIREYEILHYVWEKFRHELYAKSCSSDHMIGIPMPFEFVNVCGTEYDFEGVKNAINYFNINGAFVPASTAVVPGAPIAKPLGSFLSYMSTEKLGPSLAYLADLLKSQKKWFTVSTALKVLDQILCRLMVLHRYGVILGNLDFRHLNFGVREAVNVLYINNFDCAVVAPTTQRPVNYFNERFASIGALKGVQHFVNDIETAFYIFMAMVAPRLPWDERPTGNEGTGNGEMQRDGSWNVGGNTKYRSALKMHLDERNKLWDNTVLIDRMLNSYTMNTEMASETMKGFACDVVQMIYVKTKEAMTTCASMPQQEFMTNAMTVSTVANNAYIGIRKVIVSFFRFESLSTSLRDVTCQNKVDQLLASEPVDCRALWDLNNWCWNMFETTFLSASRSSWRSVKL